MSPTVQVVDADGDTFAGWQLSEEMPKELPLPVLALKRAAWARYRSARLNVKVAATGAAAVCTMSSIAVSMLFNVARRVNPAPAVMVPKCPESSMTTPKTNSSPAVGVAAVLVIAFDAVVPSA